MGAFSFVFPLFFAPNSTTLYDDDDEDDDEGAGAFVLDLVRENRTLGQTINN